jgi:uncharacterized surface protein with fasciclin (FAS1) repeats
MKKLLAFALCLLLCASFLYCSKKEEAPKEESIATTPGDIVEIATADGRFTTLVKAVEAAGLVETLKGEGPFTVFAPTDEAFGKLPPGSLDGLIADVPQLKNILLYHVVPGKVMAADVVKLATAATALGPEIAIATTPEGAVTINGATVLVTDIEAKNGVIHVIDAVILPPPPPAQ